MVTVYLWLHRFPPPLHLPAATGSHIVCCVTIIRDGQSNLTHSKDTVLFVGAAEGNSMKSVLQTRLSGSEGKIKKLQVA